jgi:hypothetical protein
MNKNCFVKLAFRCENKAQKYLILDNRIAFFRLVSTIILLAVLVSYTEKYGFYMGLFSVIVFLIYCLILSVIHKKIQKIQNFWKCIAKSYRLSLARYERNFQFLQEHCSPWHNSISILPQNHFYACDIDLHKELFLFMNTCSTEGGSTKLFNLLVNAGIEIETETAKLQRTELAKIFSKNNSLLRRFESLKLSDEFLKNYFKSKEINTNFQFNSKLLVYSFFSISVWGILFIPLFLKFLQTKNINIFIQPVFLYLFFILFGVFIFQPLIQKAIEIEQSLKYINIIIKEISIKKIKIDNIFSHEENIFSHKSSKIIRILSYLIDFLTLRGNPVFWLFIHIFLPFDALFCIGVFFILKKVIKYFSIWKNEVDEFDLLLTFARLKSENPEFTFNVEKTENIIAHSMGHPLLPYSKRVSNTFTLNENSPVVLLTGSNMSGKSTFLRALATNILLANIGAPICAKKLELPQLKILCAIRIDDSLADGTSYFYAEVKRLAAILQELKNTKIKCIFFIDEIFKGTNNKERYLGSCSVLKAFLELPHFGFVTTHDLALTELANSQTRLRNMHFREHIENDTLLFDYQLREGPCPTTNALFIMKSAGLPILTELL